MYSNKNVTYLTVWAPCSFTLMTLATFKRKGSARPIEKCAQSLLAINIVISVYYGATDGCH